MDTTLAKTNRATVLIVDDSPDTLTLLSGLLKDDYRVKIASKGEQALAIARGAPTVTAVSIPPPDLILLDVMMPGIDGYEVCRQLKADPLTQQIPVIFLTAKNDIADEEQGFALGAVDYITKPVSPPILLARVKTHLHLKATYDHLKRLLKFREDMVNMLVHDLRNPLSTIVPIVDLMLKSPDLPVERQQKMLKLMQKGGQQLQVLVEDLLLKAKLESGTLTLERQPTNLCDLCDLALETFGDSMIHKNIQLTTHYPPPPHRLMAVDASLYRRALENLIANALKFSPPDSEVVISVTYPDTAGATVAIADRGPGVASQFREQIFEKYEIGPLWAGIPQMGLGLAFCKAIVEAHGGRIWVMDNPPRGSIFTIELPC